MGGDQGAGADGGAVEHGGAVGDERLLADRRSVHHAEVGDRRAGADLARQVGRSVQDRPVLHVGAGAHEDLRVVGPDHGAVPDGGTGLHHDVADQAGRRGDEGVGVDGGALPLEREQRHGSTVDPVEGSGRG